MKKAVSEFLSRQWLNILESIDQGIVVVDPEGKVQFMNEAAAQLTGHSAARALERPADQILGRRPWVADLLTATREAPLRHVRSDVALVDRWGGQMPVQATATPLTDDEGEGIGTLLTLEDLTRKRDLEAHGLEVERLAELETLVAGLAHEIKNPLSGMRGAAQLLLGSSRGDDRVQECTRIMVEEIDRLNGLMAQLLELTGPPRMERAAVNIHQILDRVVAIEGAGGPRFLREFDPSLPAVTGDASRLTQVLLNLVRNAVEATPQGGTIRLATRMETTYRVGRTHGRERFLSVEISDEGEGITEENLPRIFSPFFTTKSGGTGLGLAISQRIVAEHGGVLRARSAPGGGATFTVTLPVDGGASNGA
jgi:two-component system nitrogen regulation sensor histidine kinase GlnL